VSPPLPRQPRLTSGLVRLFGRFGSFPISHHVQPCTSLHLNRHQQESRKKCLLCVLSVIEGGEDRVGCIHGTPLHWIVHVPSPSRSRPMEPSAYFSLFWWEMSLVCVCGGVLLVGDACVAVCMLANILPERR
jgi:hypothetical protein